MGNNPNNPCIFCQLNKQQKYKILQNQQYFAFHDINKASSQYHILVCTKQHIKNVYYLSSQQQIQKMYKFGQNVLNYICDRNGISIINRKYRFGFHLPPYNSVHHIHLHCFVQPITNCMYNKFHYGFMLYSIQEAQEKWRNYRNCC